MTDKAAQADSGAGTTPAADTPRTDAGKPAPKGDQGSVRSSVERALAAVEADPGPPNQTDQARAVLRGGAGSDEKLLADDQAQRDKRTEALDRAARKAAEKEDDAGDDKADKDTKRKAPEKADAKDAKKAKGEADDDADDDDDAGDDKGDDAKAGKDKAAKDAAGKDKAGQDKAKAERERDATGKFKAGDDPDAEDTDERVSEPPVRLSDGAKAVWKNAPKEIRGDVHRIVREFESGYAKHREAADNWNGLNNAFSPATGQDGKPLTYGELAKQLKTTPKGALDNYVALDIQLSKDPIGVIDKMLQARGMDFRKVAEAYLKIDPAALKAHQEKQALADENERLKRAETERTSSVERQQRERVDNQLNQFYDKHPRLAADKEFEKTFGALFVGGSAKTLDEAYEMAERAHPRKAPRTDAPDTADQTRKSDLSASGTRTSASDATSRRERSKNPREAAERAARDAGL